MNRLSGKIALITGGTTGIGMATARLFQEEGAQVIITGRNEQTLAEARNLLGPHATVISSDTSRLSEIQSLVEQVKEKFGKLDVLFANAGIAQFAPVEQVNEEFFDEQFDINVKGLYFTVQGLLPLMAEGGSIILNASVVSKKGMPGASIYSATKAAVRSFGRTLAAELAPRGIRVNTVSPGPIRTPILKKMQMPAEVAAQLETNLVNGVALKRLGEPEELAQVVLFLASSEASYVVGIELFADGGMAEL